MWTPFSKRSKDFPADVLKQYKNRERINISRTAPSEVYLLTGAVLLCENDFIPDTQGWFTQYYGEKEKGHNFLWPKWYSRRESNPQRPLRRGLLYPFNYGSLSENAKKINCKPNIFILHHLHEKCKDFRGGVCRLPKFKLCVHVYRLIAFCLVLGVRIPKSQASDSIQKKAEGRNSLALLRCGSRVALGQKHLCGKGKGRVWVL